MTKHRDPGDDLPRRDRKFVTGGEGARFDHGVRIGESQRNRTNKPPPKRPPFCLLMEDLADADPSTAVFGMYPASLIPKLLPWLRADRRAILHVCSGGLPPGEGVRVDIRPDARPDVVADGRALPFADASFPAIMLDPPYTEHYALELYRTEYPRPAHLLAEAARVVVPCGRLVFVHYILPNPPPGCHFVKAFGLSMGFGYPTRTVSVFERDQAGLF